MFFLSSLSLCDVMKERSINAIEIGESHERDNFHMNWVFLEHGSFISLHLYFKNTGCWNEMKDRLVSYWCLSSKFEVQTRPPRQGRSEIRDKLPFSVLKCPLWSLRYFRQRKKKLRKSPLLFEVKSQTWGQFAGQKLSHKFFSQRPLVIFFVWLRYKKGEKEVGVGRVIRGKCALLPLVWRRIVCKK